MEIKMTEKQFRRLLDLVYIGNWILNSTRGDDRIRQYDEVESLVFSQCLAHGMAPLTELYQGQLIPSQAFAEGGIHEAIMAYEDIKVYATVRVYVPGRSKPMTTLHPNDSIFWEDFGGSVTEAAARIIPEREMLKEAAEFAGTVPVKHLVPIWKTGKRYLYTGGSVQMRDAAIYVRENSWDNAFELWHQAFEGTKNTKKQMRTAFNIAVYYETKDSLSQAVKWAEKAQQLAKKIDKKNITDSVQASIDDVPNYYLTTLYLAELKERNAQLPKLKLQMSRFNDDF